MCSKEDVSRRTFSSKTFILGNSRYCSYMFTETVHVQDLSGAWTEIDNTLIEDKDGSGRLLRNTDNPALHVILRSGKSPELVRLEEPDGFFISWTVSGVSDAEPRTVVPSPAPEQEGPFSPEQLYARVNTEAEYEEILPGTTLKCRIRSTMFKDEWVFAKKEYVRPVVLQICAPGLCLSLNDKNQIEASAPSGEVPFILLAPFMKQSDEGIPSGPVKTDLVPSPDPHLYSGRRLAQ